MRIMSREEIPMKKEVITLPQSLSLPFSPGIRAGDFIYVSGQVGFVDAEGKKVKGIEAQTRLCLENMQKVLIAGGASLMDVVKVTVFLRRQKDFAKMNRVYKEYFNEPLPARSTVITALALPEMLIEIECVAYVPKRRSHRSKRR